MPTDRMKPYRDALERALPHTLADVKPAKLREAALHYPAAGGKRLRPLLALLAADAVGTGKDDGSGAPSWHKAMPVAAAIELVHNFSLVHDDIMDGDEIRRGLPTVHKQWGEPVGILAGDVLFAKAFELLADGLDAATCRRVLLDLATTVRVLCEGQALDMAFEDRASDDPPTVADYMHMIDGKTARLFQCAARCGGWVAGADDAQTKGLETYGRALGLAFQVQDDVLDVTQDTKVRGKERYADIRRGKRTYLVLHALEHARGVDRDALLVALGNEDATEVMLARAGAALESSGALDAAREVVANHTRVALAALDALPAGDAKETLRRLAEWAAGREK